MDYFVILQIIISFGLLAMLVNQVRKMHRKPQNSAVLGETPAVAESLADSDRSWRYKTSPPSKKRPWWRLYGVTLGIALVGVVQTGHHAWFEYSNPPPLFDELQMQRVEVLGWQRQHPQLHVRLPDGSSRMVEFPTLRLGKGGSLLRNLFRGPAPTCGSNLSDVGPTFELQFSRQLPSVCIGM
jgi:hypothetical protein